MRLTVTQDNAGSNPVTHPNLRNAVENQHDKITGYRDFDQDTIDVINAIKDVEAVVANFWSQLRASDKVDQRELALARTHIEQGFMHFVKSVAKPDTPWQ